MNNFDNSTITTLNLEKPCAILFMLLFHLFSSYADAQPMKLYLAGTVFNSDLSSLPPNNGYVTNFEAINANYVKTFDNFYLTSDIHGTIYTFAIRCRTNGAGGRVFSATILVGGEEVANASWNVSSNTMTLYTTTVTGVDPTVTTSTEVKLIVTINGTSGATSAITLGDASQSTPLYSYIEIPSIISTSTKEPQHTIVKLVLGQNYPNPFNPTTTIEYQIPRESFVTLKIFDMLGQEVATLVNEVKNAGSYSTQWSANEFPSGVYFYKLNASDFQETKRLVLLK